VFKFYTRFSKKGGRALIREGVINQDFTVVMEIPAYTLKELH
jgi:hypothetical protein